MTESSYDEIKAGYLGRCHSRSLFEPLLQLCALSPTRPTALMQLPCIKSRLACNLQTETKQKETFTHSLTHAGKHHHHHHHHHAFRSAINKNTRQFQISQNKPPFVPVKHLMSYFGCRDESDSEASPCWHDGGGPADTLRPTCIYVSSMWGLTSAFPQVCLYLTLVNRRSPVCTGLDIINGCIMSRNKELFSSNKGANTRGKVASTGHREDCFVNWASGEVKMQTLYSSFYKPWLQTLFTSRTTDLGSSAQFISGSHSGI